MSPLVNWFRRGKMERELNRELSYHTDRRIADLMRSGLSEQQARREVSLEVGGLPQIQEEVRDVWLTRWMRDFLYDLRFSTRSFLRNPSFTITAALSLALGIGASTAIYSLVDQVLLHRLPVREPDRLVLIDWKGDYASVNGFGTRNLMSYPICRNLQQQTQFFEGVFCRAETTVNLTTGSEPAITAAEIVSGSYFSVLGVRPALGRLIDDADDGAPGANPVVVLSYDFWKTRLAGAPDVLGRKVLINQNPMTVIGVASPVFRGIDVGVVPALWIPASLSSQAIPGFKDHLDRRTRWMQVLGRLQQGLTPAQAQAGLEPWFKAMLDDDMRRPGFPRITSERRRRYLASTLTLTPAPQGHSSLRRRMAEPLWVLFAATGVLLSLACLNVAGLFLARGSAREREMSTRLALGASRGRIGRQAITDAMLIAFVGGLLGIVLAPLAVRALIAFLPRDTAANALTSSIDSRLLLFSFIASGVAGILSGVAPALRAGRESLIGSLRQRTGAALGGVRLRKAIVTVQIAFTLILVIGAGLFVRTLSELMAKGPGFTTASMVEFGIAPLRNGYSKTQSTQRMRRIYDALRTSPNVNAVAIVQNALLTGGSWNDPMTIQTNQRIVTDHDINLNAVTPGFFSTLGIGFVAGRDFEERDSRPVAIVNEAFARHYLGGPTALGGLIASGNGPDVKPDTEVIGVVANFSYRGIREESEQAYFPILADGITGGSFYVKARGTPEGAFQSIRRIVGNVDPALPVNALRTVDEQVSRSLNTERMLATLSGSFSTLAMLLSLVGLYGVMSFVVTQRTREIGIRLALGATGRTAIWFVLRDALAMIAGGAAIALPCAAAFGRLLESQLYGVKPMDPVAIAGATLILVAAGIAAALIPARRASAVNPVEALRFD